MYNRYIPQSDGSYRRNTMPDKNPSSPQARNETKPVNTEVQHILPPQTHHSSPPKPEGIFGFLKQLLPRGFDTADLLIILIILLMAGDCEEERNNALLTLALYLFM